MTYTIQEIVETVGWSRGIDNAPAELVKLAKDMAEKGEPATFGQIIEKEGPQPQQEKLTWCIISVKPDGKLFVVKRVNS